MLSGYFANIKMPVRQSVVTALQKQASPERLRRAKSFRQGGDQLRCLLAESLLKQALTHRGVPAGEQRIQRNRLGKPVLATSDSHHFNVSHSGQWVACAVGDQPVGIDIERKLRRNLEFDGLFTLEEMNYLESGGRGALWRRFYRLWTLKESYLKALGTGLYQSMQSFTVRILDNHRARLLIANRPQDSWYFYSFEPDAEHMCSICARRPIRTEQFHFRYID